MFDSEGDENSRTLKGFVYMGIGYIVGVNKARVVSITTIMKKIRPNRGHIRYKSMIII